MTYRVWGDRFESGELLTTAKSQPLTPNADMYLSTVRATMIFINNPTFTSLTAKIYSDEGGLPSTLLYSSTTSLTKAEILTEENGSREMYFNFNGEPLTATVPYHVVINGAGYVPDATSFILWQKAFPNSVYSVTGVSEDPIKLGIYPYHAYLVGSKL